MYEYILNKEQNISINDEIILKPEELLDAIVFVITRFIHYINKQVSLILMYLKFWV